jgi:phosphoenolpyruvate carboxykinase (ATP)
MAGTVLAAGSAPAEPSAADGSVDLRQLGLKMTGRLHINLSPAVLTEQAILRGEGLLTRKGALVAYTGSRTGRSPQDRWVVPEQDKSETVWWGPVNRSMESDRFDKLFAKVQAYLAGKELFVHDGWACADPEHRLKVRLIAEKAWHALFAQCLLIRPPRYEANAFEPDLTIVDVCDLQVDPEVDGTRSEVFIVLNLERRLVLIAGTQYAGEIKKSVFSVLNYLMPSRHVFPMHCSANIGRNGKTALFFGLSGTGKTTLSTNPERRLIGDDEHGWSDQGVFNFEGGCYAKTIHLSEKREPQIFHAIRFGCVLENVVIDPVSRWPDFDDGRYTENTRAAYPVDFIENCELSGMGGHPEHVIFLTCDAFGVLPPVSRLTYEQSLYHFLSGYTAKVAGTETGVTDPKVTFSTCFAAPFLPLHPVRYAEMLGERLKKHGSPVWFVNTGWTGGPYGTGKRIDLVHTRAMVAAILNGELEKVRRRPHPIFRVEVPQSCPGVPAEVLDPRKTWQSPSDYDTAARHLARLFQGNFAQYADSVPRAVAEAGPK